VKKGDGRSLGKSTNRGVRGGKSGVRKTLKGETDFQKNTRPGRKTGAAETGGVKAETDVSPADRERK